MTRHEQAWAKWEQARKAMTPRQLDYVESRITADRVNAEIDRAWKNPKYVDRISAGPYPAVYPQYTGSLRELMTTLVYNWKRNSCYAIHRYERNDDGSQGAYLGDVRSIMR